jgi:hypothetical protein
MSSHEENVQKVKKLFRDMHPYWAEGHATSMIKKVPDVRERISLYRIRNDEYFRERRRRDF